jgi:putative membrane protein
MEVAMMGWYQDGWGGYGAIGMVLMVVIWGGLIALAAWGIARATRSQTHVAVQTEPPRAILDRRFASGEMDAEAYAQARRILEGQATDPSAR